MPPTKEEIAIFVGSELITDSVPVKSIRVTNERGNRSGSASLMVEDGGSFSIMPWNSLTIIITDTSQTIFFGYITDLKEIKRGIQLDYEIQAVGKDSLLNNTFVNGSFTGDDADILAALLVGAYPDYSSLFDFSSNVTALSIGDLDFDVNNLSLSDAIGDLADMVGADYFVGMGTGSRINQVPNPNMDTNGDFYGGTIAPNGFYQPVGWNPSNAVWGAALGDGDGGYEITSQLITNEEVYFRVGKSIDSDPFVFNFVFDGGSGLAQWVKFSFRAFITSITIGQLAIKVNVITYDEDGNFYGEDLVSVTSMPAGVWRDRGSAFFMDTDDFPAKGTFEIQLFLEDTALIPFTLRLDDFSVEIVPSSSFPSGSSYPYFDGDSTDAIWLGTVDASASHLSTTASAAPLVWSDTPLDTPFDIDIGVGDELISDLDYNQFAGDGINTVIVVGGKTLIDFDFVYPANGELTHFDLELLVLPVDGNSVITVYKNTGTDVSPSWTAQTVGNWHSDDFTGSDTVLYDDDSHWLQWETAPSDLLKSWRVVGRVEKRLRIVVTDDDNITDIGFQTATTIYDDTVTSESDAMNIGNAELSARTAPKNITFTTYEPGIEAGQQIQITDSTRSISETMIVQKVERRYLGGGYATFDVECGVYTPNAIDMIVENHNIGQDMPPFVDNALIQLRLLTDDDGAYLLDDEGRRLFDSIEI